MTNKEISVKNLNLNNRKIVNILERFVRFYKSSKVLANKDMVIHIFMMVH